MGAGVSAPSLSQPVKARKAQAVSERRFMAPDPTQQACRAPRPVFSRPCAPLWAKNQHPERGITGTGRGEWVGDPLAGGVVAASVRTVANPLALYLIAHRDRHRSHVERGFEGGAGGDAKLVGGVVRAQEEPRAARVRVGGGGRLIARRGDRQIGDLAGHATRAERGQLVDGAVLARGHLRDHVERPGGRIESSATPRCGGRRGS